MSPALLSRVIPLAPPLPPLPHTRTRSPPIQPRQSITTTTTTTTHSGKIIRVEAHPIPEHPRPRRVKGRVALVGDAAGYVTKCSGEGIYFAAKSGRMAGEAVARYSENGTKMVGEKALR